MLCFFMYKCQTGGFVVLTRNKLPLPCHFYRLPIIVGGDFNLPHLHYCLTEFLFYFQLISPSGNRMRSYLTSAKAQKLKHRASPHLSSNGTMGESSKKLKGRISETIEGEFGGQFSQLTEDIVLDIFSRLPFKDLKRCRCVRKSWYQTIPSPCFSKLHHEKSASRGTHLVSYILQQFNAMNPRVPHDLYLLEFYYSIGSGTYVFDIVPLRTILKDMNLEYGIVGSCNGLLCLSEPFLSDPVYICNPLLGEYITLPPVAGFTKLPVVSGFGIDQITGDYKVIRMVYHRNVLRYGETPFELKAEIYTLGSKNWRKIGAVPFMPCGGNPGVFLNGVIHWMTNDSLRKEEAYNIVCFDISSEKCRLLRLPPGYNNVQMDSERADSRHLELRVIKENLCLFDGNRGRFAVWVMERYGDEQSWIKPRNVVPSRTSDKIGTKPRYFDGLLQVHLLCSTLNIQGIPLFSDVCPHVVSLVSHIDPKEDASGGEDSLKLEKWSKRLYPIERQASRPATGREMSLSYQLCVEEEEEEDYFPELTISQLEVIGGLLIG